MGIFEPLEQMSWSRSIASRVVTRASLSAKPESAEEWKTHAIFGPSLRVSFSYFDPDSCCWKTSQGTFLLDLERFSEIWPDSGTMRNGCVYERRISGLPTFESGSSSWPTTRAFWSQGGNRKDEPGLDQQARFFPTPQAADGKMVKGGKRGPENNPSLTTAAGSLQDRLTPDGPQFSETGPTLPLRLNPRFVEWLMGFPVGWTEL